MVIPLLSVLEIDGPRTNWEASETTVQNAQSGVLQSVLIIFLITRLNYVGESSSNNKKKDKNNIKKIV